MWEQRSARTCIRQLHGHSAFAGGLRRVLILLLQPRQFERLTLRRGQPPHAVLHPGRPSRAELLNHLLIAEQSFGSLWGQAAAPAAEQDCEAAEEGEGEGSQERDEAWRVLKGNGADERGWGRGGAPRWGVGARPWGW